MPIKLHLGSGGIRIPGYLNVDLRPGPHIDFIDDVGVLSQFKTGTIQSIYACHVLEHFSHEMGTSTQKCTEVLKRWHELLVPGGTLYVAVPNLDKIFKAILKGRRYKDTLGYIMAIYGGQDYPQNVHYTGFTKSILIDLLKSLGFLCPVEFNPWVDDTTRFQLRGVPMSLNLKAFKGGGDTSFNQKIKWMIESHLKKND
jgi:predicted SAM-dependent methyltransferase